MSRLILASASPRRREILENLGLTFTVFPTNAQEIMPPDKEPAEVVSLLSKQKAKAAEMALPSLAPEDTLLAADTLVSIGQKILGKPRSKEEAFSMLHALSGQWHQVYSGITLVRNQKYLSDTVCTKVKFRELSEEEIADYIQTGEPMDKAGAYGIQGRAGLFVERLEGDWYAVVGLPICRLETLLQENFGQGLSQFKKG
jgi:septum formation protein